MQGLKRTNLVYMLIGGGEHTSVTAVVSMRIRWLVDYDFVVLVSYRQYGIRHVNHCINYCLACVSQGGGLYSLGLNMLWYLLRWAHSACDLNCDPICLYIMWY